MTDSDKTKKERFKKGKKLLYQASAMKRRFFNAASYHAIEGNSVLRSHADADPACIYVCDESYVIRFMNAAMTKKIGRDAAGEKCHRVFFGGEHPCSWCPRESLLSGETVTMEQKISLDNRWYHMTYSPLNIQGDVLTQAHWFDITPWKQKVESLKETRKEMESLLMERTGSILAMNRMLQGEMAVRKERENELQFKDLAIRSSVNAVVFANARGIVTFVNDFFSVMWRLEGEDDAVGKPLDCFWLKNPQGASFTDLLSHGGSWMGEITALRKDGTEFESLVSVTSVDDDSSGEARIFCTAVDISERKSAETFLDESRERFQRVIQSMPVLVDAMDDKGTIIFWNSECERVTGYLASEIVGNPDALNSLYPDQAYLENRKELWAEKGNNFREWEMTLTTKNGAQRIISWSNIAGTAPIPGWASWAVGIDVTDRRRLEEQIIDISDREFAGIHEELKATVMTPVEALDAMMQTLMPPGGERDRGLASIGAIKSGVDSLLRYTGHASMEQGFVNGVRDMCMGIERLYRVRCDVQCDEGFAVKDKNLEEQLIFIVREAVHRAARGGAGDIRVLLVAGKDSAVNIEDNAPREVGSPADEFSFDLMRYRAEIAGFHMELSPVTAGGTRVTIVL